MVGCREANAVYKAVVPGRISIVEGGSTLAPPLLIAGLCLQARRAHPEGCAGGARSHVDNGVYNVHAHPILLPAQASAAKAGALILEAVPVVREAMLRGRSWPAVAQRAAKEHFGDAAARMARERIEAMVKVGLGASGSLLEVLGCDGRLVVFGGRGGGAARERIKSHGQSDLSQHLGLGWVEGRFPRRLVMPAILANDRCAQREVPPPPCDLITACAGWVGSRCLHGAGPPTIFAYEPSRNANVPSSHPSIASAAPGFPYAAGAGAAGGARRGGSGWGGRSRRAAAARQSGHVAEGGFVYRCHRGSHVTSTSYSVPQAILEPVARAAWLCCCETCNLHGVAPPLAVQVHDSGVYEPWYDFVMEVDDSRPPEHVEVAAANAGAASSSSKAGSGSGGSGSAQAAAVVHGLRYRLKALDFDSTRPLPANGKVCIGAGLESMIVPMDRCVQLFDGRVGGRAGAGASLPLPSLTTLPLALGATCAAS